jgi:hypothetical protein
MSKEGQENKVLFAPVIEGDSAQAGSRSVNSNSISQSDAIDVAEVKSGSAGHEKEALGASVSTDETSQTDLPRKSVQKKKKESAQQSFVVRQQKRQEAALAAKAQEKQRQDDFLASMTEEAKARYQAELREANQSNAAERLAADAAESRVLQPLVSLVSLMTPIAPISSVPQNNSEVEGKASRHKKDKSQKKSKHKGKARMSLEEFHQAASAVQVQDARAGFKNDIWNLID